MGLKLPQGLIEADSQAANGADAPAILHTSPIVTDKSLALVKRGATDQPRLGRELGAGVASWYGPHFQGRRTASGERFDRLALTAAHKTLPLGTRVVVSNPRTGKRIVVRINDRGPYVGNRILDLSEAAARALGLKARGHDWVVMNTVLPSPDGPDTAAYAEAHAAAADVPADTSADAPEASAATDLTRATAIANPALKPATAVSETTAAPHDRLIAEK